MAIKLRVGGNYSLNETALDSDMNPIIHMGERVVISEFYPIPGWVIIKNKIGETVLTHSNKLSPVRGRPMRVIG
jgi:hypothetical protein